MVYFSCGLFPTKSLSGAANYRGKPRRDWERALPTYCTSPPPLSGGMDRVYSYDRQQRKLAQAVGLKLN